MKIRDLELQLNRWYFFRLAARDNKKTQHGIIAQIIAGIEGDAEHPDELLLKSQDGLFIYLRFITEAEGEHPTNSESVFLRAESVEPGWILEDIIANLKKIFVESPELAEPKILTDLKDLFGDKQVSLLARLRAAQHKEFQAAQD